VLRSLRPSTINALKARNRAIPGLSPFGSKASVSELLVRTKSLARQDVDQITGGVRSGYARSILRQRGSFVFSYFPFESTSSGGPVTIMPWVSKTRFNPSICSAV
jgi:hypothetical protein